MTLDTALIARALRSRRTAHLIARSLNLTRAPKDRPDREWIRLFAVLFPLLAAGSVDTAALLDRDDRVACAVRSALEIPEWQLLEAEPTVELIDAWNAGRGTGWRPTKPKSKPRLRSWEIGTDLASLKAAI